MKYTNELCKQTCSIEIQIMKKYTEFMVIAYNQPLMETHSFSDNNSQKHFEVLLLFLPNEICQAQKLIR